MSACRRPNVAQIARQVSTDQFGYFTRAQAHALGVRDYELVRAVESGQLERADRGVYRIAGGPLDGLSALRSRYLRLDPTTWPHQRALQPWLWVSHQSAAEVFGYGFFVAETPEFTTTRRLQARTNARTYLRSRGVPRQEWTLRHGLPATTPARTAQDMLTTGVPGAKVASFMSDAIADGVPVERFEEALSEASVRELLASR